MNCPECNRLMIALVSDSHPQASEFYCQLCSKSVQMTEKQYAQHQGGGPLRGPGALRSP